MKNDKFEINANIIVNQWYKSNFITEVIQISKASLVVHTTSVRGLEHGRLAVRT
jgi:hypothetical protein